MVDMVKRSLLSKKTRSKHEVMLEEIRRGIVY